MDKKSQSGIITTVLLILIVLAAVILLWVMIRNFIKPHIFDARGDCMKVDLQFVSETVACNAATGIVDGSFRRKEDEVGNISTTIVIEGKVFEKSAAGISTGGVSRSPGTLETGHFSVSIGSFTDGQEIKIGVASVVGERLDVVCDVSDEITITCAA